MQQRKKFIFCRCSIMLFATILLYFSHSFYYTFRINSIVLFAHIILYFLHALCYMYHTVLHITQFKAKMGFLWQNIHDGKQRVLKER